MHRNRLHEGIFDIFKLVFHRSCRFIKQQVKDRERINADYSLRSTRNAIIR